MVAALSLGILSSFFGFAAPGMLNITASKISVDYNKNKAFKFVLAVSLVTVLQSLIAIYLVKVSTESSDILSVIQKFSIAIFIILSFYFFRKSYQDHKQTTQNNKVRKPFLYGLILASANMFAIPFFYGVFLLYASKNSFFNKAGDLAFLVLGVLVGFHLIFGSYVILASKMRSKIARISKYLNLVLASLTGLIAIVSLVKLL